MSADPRRVASPSGTGGGAADRCRGVASYGVHAWKRIYQGATLDVYKCVNVSCGRHCNTEGTALHAR